MGRRRFQDPPLRQTPNGKTWALRVREDVLQADGSIKRLERWEYLGSVDAIGKREAERRRADFLKRLNNTEEMIQAQVPMATILKAYREIVIPALKPNSRHTYAAVLGKRIEPVFAGKTLRDMTAMEVQRWCNSMSGIAPATRKLALAVLKAVLEQAARWGYTDRRNPCDGIRIPNDGGKIIDRDTRALTLDETRRLIGAADAHSEDLGGMVRTGVFCGLRIGELIGATWADYRPPSIRVERSMPQRGGRVTSTKSAAGRRTVPLGPVCLRRPANTKDGDPIFCKIRNQWTATKYIKRAAASVGIKFVGFGWHTLRHTFAQLMQDGELREFMGHATEAMSRSYVTDASVDLERRQRRAAEMVFFGGEGTGKRQ